MAIDVKPSLTLKRRFNAAPARVFSAWTDPQKIVRWFGPEQVEVVRAEAEPRTGGRYRIVARSPDGEEHPREPSKGVHGNPRGSRRPPIT